MLFAMRALALGLLAWMCAGCPGSAAECLGQKLPDGGGGVPVCSEQTICKPCWSCQMFGPSPGWRLLDVAESCCGVRPSDAAVSALPECDAGTCGACAACANGAWTVVSDGCAPDAR